MRKVLTPKEFAKLRAKRQDDVMVLVNAIHDAGFGSVLIESTKIGMEDYWLRVVIDTKEMSSDQLDKLKGKVESLGGSLSLRNDHDYGVRLAAWLPHG